MEKMEFGVLELGLKNGQISHVYSFLMIHAEIFKKILQEENDSKLQFNCLKQALEEWNQVFELINEVLRTKLSLFVDEKEEFHFGKKLVRVSLVVICKLVHTLVHANLSDNDDELKCCKESLLQALHERSVQIRNYIDNELLAAYLRKEANSSQVQLFVSVSTCEQFQNYLDGISDDHGDWNSCCSFAMDKLCHHLQRNEMEKVHSILVRMALPVWQTLLYILLHTSKGDIKNALLSYLQEHNKLDQDMVECVQHMQTIEGCMRDTNLLTLSSIDHATSHSIMQITLVSLSGQSDMATDNLTCMMAHGIELEDILRFGFLTSNRPLIMQVINACQAKGQFSLFERVLSEHTQESPECTVDWTRDELAKRDELLAHEPQNIQATLKRMYALRARQPLLRGAPLLTTLSDSLRVALFEYAMDNQLLELALWMLNTRLVTLNAYTGADTAIKRLLESYVKCKENNMSNWNKFALTGFAYIWRLPFANVESVMETGSILETALCYFIEPNEKAKSSLLSLTKSAYPLLTSCLNNERKVKEIFSMYSLAKYTIFLRLDQLFQWQIKNEFGQKNAEVSMPHFSSQELSEASGMRAQLNYVYYLSRARPLDAYVNFRENGDAENEKNVRAAVRNACLLAYYNTDDSKISAGCSFFLELLQQDKSDLLFILRVAKVITKYAGDYLGLTERAKQQEMGRLLKLAEQAKSKLAQNKLIELLLSAFRKKFSQDLLIVEELIEYELLVQLSKRYQTPLPMEFLHKCLAKQEWLLFCVYIQMYNYPKDTVLQLLSQPGPRNPMTEHMHTAFAHSHLLAIREVLYRRGSPQDQASMLKRTRDSLYTRVGLIKSNTDSPLERSGSKPSSNSPSLDTASFMNMSDADLSTLELTTVTSGSAHDDSAIEQLPWVDACDKSRTLFGLLLACQQTSYADMYQLLLCSTVRLHNPIGALIACSLINKKPVRRGNNQTYESLVNEFDCFCCWLLASFRVESIELREAREYDHVSWNGGELLSLLRDALTNPRNLLHLRDGLNIFAVAKNSPLHTLVAFLIDFMLEKNYYDSLLLLQEYVQRLNDWKNEPINDQKLLYSLGWVEELSMLLLESALRCISCALEHQIILQHLSECEMHKHMPRGRLRMAPQFACMASISNECKLSLHIAELFADDLDEQEVVKRLWNIMNTLQQKHLFEEAEKIGELFDLDKRRWLLNELTIKATICKEDSQFWLNAFVALSQGKLDKALQVTFLQEQHSRIDSLPIKCLLLTQLYMQTLDESSASMCARDLWLALVQLEMSGEASEQQLEHVHVQLIECGVRLEAHCSSHQLNTELNESVSQLSPVQLTTFEKILCKVLNAGCIQLACDAANELLYAPRALHLVLKAETVILNAQKSISDTPLEPLDNVLRQLPVKDCKGIMLMMRSACILRLSIAHVHAEMENSLSLLDRLITHYAARPEVIYVIRELIAYKQIKDEELVQFICADMHRLLQIEEDEEEPIEEAEEAAYMNTVPRTGVSLDLNVLVNNSPTRQQLSTSPMSIVQLSKTNTQPDFLLFARLLHNPSTLGKELMYLLTQHEDAQEQVQLCIKAHECFSLTRDIEGISQVLEYARVFIQTRLAPSGENALIVKLFTRIGRFSEMRYVFTILKEAHAMELLMCKSSQRSAALRLALLDALNEDRDLYSLIALHFSMHREIGELMIGQAVTHLRGQSSLMTTSQPRVQRYASTQAALSMFTSSNVREAILARDRLRSAMEDLLDAADSYSRGGCLAQAAAVERIAQLVALQLHLLPTGKRVLQLSASQVEQFVINHTKFHEAQIVVDAYATHMDWSAPLFYRVLRAGDWQYYRDFCTRHTLSVSLCTQLNARYAQLKRTKQQPPLNNEMASQIRNNFQKFITLVPDICCMYKLALEHNFVSISSNLVESKSGGYIKDLKRKGSF